MSVRMWVTSACLAGASFAASGLMAAEYRGTVIAAGLPGRNRLDAAAPAGAAQLSVLVWNVAGVPPAELERAVTAAAEMYRAAGMSSEWVVCSEEVGACRRPNGTEAVLRIVADRKRYGAPNGSFGGVPLVEGNRPGRMALVFWNQVQMGLQSPQSSIAALLACVMAHEVGHILLGPGHGASGIMQGCWGVRQMQQIDQRAMRFADTESARLRAVLEQGRLPAAQRQ